MRDQKGEYELWCHWYQENFFQTVLANWVQLEVAFFFGFVQELWISIAKYNGYS